MITARMLSALYPSKPVSEVVVMVLVIMSSFANSETARADDPRIHGIPGSHRPNGLASRPRFATGSDRQPPSEYECAGDAVSGDPWWLKVHVWSTMQEGNVADFFVDCAHVQQGENCPVPICVKIIRSSQCDQLACGRIHA